MLLLALDTATPAVTVALHDGTSVIASSSQVDARRHGELLLPAVDRVLAEADLKLDAVTGIVVGVGPGPYTGLRVGLMTADTFGLVLGVPVHGLCTLDGLAYAADGAGVEGPFVVATDARRKEVYWARYDDPRTRVSEPAVDRPAEIAEAVAGLPAVGAGALLYPDTFPDAREPGHVSAAALASLAAERLAAGEELAAPRPLYLRRPDAQVPKNYKVVTPK
ncbi:tRNA (adenosine(37)-N6)-threonylcarbamoyltransferase complex dimerization subunit type 1 TsaB [Streptomyces sp. NPDC059441]|uniref:tRNA (adenosine(37)-N6)-threonylcarbamoyltransferase complex dimerization subunit type 1 TsaB n=1 Tax=Streptomyces sp. NPDC059441 TaxID=3346829 RepID=UPI0036B69A41